MSEPVPASAIVPQPLGGRVAVVTGACGLLGREHCAALAEAGAHVVVVDVEGGACDALAATLSEKHGVSALSVPTDITDEASVRALDEAARRRFDRVDILVNNAAINDRIEAPTGGADDTRLETYSVEAFRRVLDVNVTGTFLCARVLGAGMAARGEGSIVNVASTYAMVAPRQELYLDDEGARLFYKTAAYPTSKAAVLGLTRYLAAYWGPAGVRVNALSPGGVRTASTHEWFERNYVSHTPLRRMAAPGDYRGALVFLASDASAYMTGANLVVDGGWTCQ